MRTALLLLFPFLLGAEQYDLMITNGKIFDGAGNPSFAGDIAVRGDTIAAIGQPRDARSALQIDAQGSFGSLWLYRTPLPRPARHFCRTNRRKIHARTRNYHH